MTETKQRTLLERLVGRRLPWLAWVWAAPAVVWSLLAVAQIGASVRAGRRARSAGLTGQADEIA